jgi:sugar/nucleoside kinase (ribokinase family)
VTSSAPGLDVVGIGNAIVDVLSHTEDAFLDRHRMIKGTMTLIDEEAAERLYGEMGSPIACSGGSAANTMAGLASLGGRGAYIGKVRDDDLGDLFRRDIRAAGVAFDTPPSERGPTTGRCLIFVTPDAQRTMHTFLGASATFEPDDVDPNVVRGASITYLEGYLWDRPPARQAFLAAARLAHAAGRKVALTLSDTFCVERHREGFQELVEHHVDILFANEHEALALYRSPDLEQASRTLARHAEIVVVTRSAKGSLVLSGGELVEVPAQPVERLVDTTGAGDLYAGGFLYGLCRGHDVATCARIGSIAAAEVIGHFGARPEVPLSDLVRVATDPGR